MLRLLVDTSVWLDLATRQDGQKWIVPLRLLKLHNKLELLIPELVVDEFERNRPRLEAAVTTSVLDRLRQLRRDLRQFAGQQNEHVWLEEISQHIPLVNAITPHNFREIRKLLESGVSLTPADQEYIKAAQRGISKKAPFSTDKNSVADALIIELYASQFEQDDSDDLYAFATSNYRDFSTPYGDRRQPHPDLADLFEHQRSRYVYQVEGLNDLLIDYFGEEFTEEAEEVQFLIEEDEPRTLAEIAAAEQEYFDKVWYVRSIVHWGGAEGDESDPVSITAQEARSRKEEKYGWDELWKPLGPGHDEAWEYGFISGKLSALRWVLGSEWDFLDT